MQKTTYWIGIASLILGLLACFTIASDIQVGLVINFLLGGFVLLGISHIIRLLESNKLGK